MASEKEKSSSSDKDKKKKKSKKDDEEVDDDKKKKKTKKEKSSKEKSSKPSSSKDKVKDQPVAVEGGADDTDVSEAEIEKDDKAKSKKKDKKKKSSKPSSSKDKAKDQAVAAEGGAEETDASEAETEKKSPSTDKKKKGSRSRSNSADNDFHMDKLMVGSGKEYDNVELDKDDQEDEDDEENGEELRPIQPPNNPPMDKITLILKQPNLERLTMTKVDPANTNIRMVRDFLFKNYYKGNVIPRSEQRQLLYRTKPIFDSLEGDYNIDDAKTLADHGLTADNSMIELSKMHVYVISPSDQKSMMINNVDPMNDVIFDMKKLANSDGYPIEKLRLLHKEANNRVIEKSQNQVTFFHCGVRHNHTLILEWPKIVIKIKLPISSADDFSPKEGRQLIQDPATGRYFVLLDFVTRTELDKVQRIHDFILQETGIPIKNQSLFSNPREPESHTPNKKSSSSKPPKTRYLKEKLKVIAEYKIEENDILELEPMSVKINFVPIGEMGGSVHQTTLEYVYPNDTVQFIKDQIQAGKGAADGIPSIPSTNLSLRKVKDGQELKWDHKSLQDEGVQHLDELEVEQTK
jgi:hypothetical protein